MEKKVDASRRRACAKGQRSCKLLCGWAFVGVAIGICS